MYSINADGTGYQQVHSFVASELIGPTGLTLVGNKFYGMAAFGPNNVNNRGVVYSINQDGSGFQQLEAFTGPNGNLPTGQLVAVGSTLYGTTQSDGPAGHGEVFAINADGTNFHVVHAFAGGTSDGSAPTGLTVVGSELVGTSQGGGAQNLGTVFSMNTDGTGFQLLHSFVGTDGSGLKASVAFDGSVLYGTASGGGPLNGGAVFSLNPDGSNFQLLHAFSQSGGPSGPAGELAVINGKLMGTTSSGGNAHHGAAFSMTTDGASFEVLHLFPTASGEENGPNDQLILLGTTLYGTTNGSGNAGAVFALAVPEPSALVLALALVGCATLIACGVRRRRRSIAGVG